MFLGMDSEGHVFVVRGDVTSIACDWQLVPSGTDRDGRPGEIQSHWLKDEAFRAAWRRSGGRENAPDGSRRAVMLDRDTGSRGFIVVHTGERGNEPPAWFAEPIHAVGRLLHKPHPAALHDRARPLVALPLLGTGAGGKHRRKAGVMQALLEAADTVAREVGIDLGAGRL